MAYAFREYLCKEVQSKICGERQDIYGYPEDSFKMIADFWSVYLGIEIKPSQAATMLELMKIARSKGQKYSMDNFIDGAGYALLAGELAGRENYLPPSPPVIPTGETNAEPSE